MEACAPCSYAYASAHARQQLDFYTPTAGRLSTPRPLIIWFHGGAWLSGSQSDVPPSILALRARGYAVASVGHSLTSDPAYVYSPSSLPTPVEPEDRLT